MVKKSDQLMPGEQYEPLELRIEKDLNKQFLRALDCNDSFYEKFVHPGVILNFCSITQSPSFTLEDGIAAVAAKLKSTYHQPVPIGSHLTITWSILDVYERRSRIYQVAEVKVKDADTLIMERKIINTFVGGLYLQRRVEWEKETAYRRSITLSSFPQQGYEIVGKKKQMFIEHMRLYSGGVSGPTWPSRNIHTDREISIRSGIGRPVASGFMFEAYLVELLVNFFGESFFHCGKTDLTVIDMAGDGDTVIPKMALKEHYGQGNNYTEISADLWCENQYGNKIILGEGLVE